MALSDDRNNQVTSLARGKELTILAAAARLFRERGYSDTGVEDISSAVGMLKGSLYYYFKSKEEILFRIVKPPLEATIAAVERVAASNLQAKEKLREALKAHLEIFDEYPEIFIFLHENFASVRSEIRREIVRLRVHYDQVWVGLIESGVRSGDFRNDLDVRITTYAILGMCNWMYKWYVRGKRLSAAEIAEQYFGILTAGLLSEKSPRPGS